MKRLLFLLVALTASAAHASGWIQFTQSARVGPAAYDQWAPAVASNGFDFVVAWTTTRPNNRSAVYVTRVNSDGRLETEIAQPLDSVGATGCGISLTPGRDGYFAAWSSEGGLSAAITDSYGRVEHRVTIPQDATACASTLAAWNGVAHLVVSGSAGPFAGTLFDNNGSVNESNIPIGNTHGDARIALTADGAGFLILSTKPTPEGDTIYGRRMTSSGALSEWFPIRSVASRVSGLSVTSAGSNDVIVWSDAFGLWTMEMETLTNIAGASRQLTAEATAIGQVVRVNGRTWITYTRSRSDASSYLITLGNDGSPSTPIDLGTADPARLAWNGSRMLAVRSAPELPAFEHDIVGSFPSPVSADTAFVVSRSKTLQENGDLASDGMGNAIAVWDERISRQTQIFAARFDARKGALDPAGIQISSSGNNIYPAAAFNGTNYLVVWTRFVDQERLTVARRFSPDGKVLDSDDIIVGKASYYSEPRVASDSSNWMVAWLGTLASPSGCANTWPATRALVARISPQGTVLDKGGVVIAPLGPDQDDLDLGWTGSTYVMAFTNICAGFHLPTVTSIGAATFAADLSHSDSSFLSGVGSTAQRSGFGTPRVAATPERLFVAWVRSDAGKVGTEYRLLEDVATTATRRHAIGSSLSSPMLPGLLIGASSDSSGHFTVLTDMEIPWAAPRRGIFEATADRSAPPRFFFVLDREEILMGRPIRHNGSYWMAETNETFDPGAGAQRLWIREF